MASEEMKAAAELIRQDQTFKDDSIDIETLRAGMAELPEARKNQISHRARAFAALRARLEIQLKSR